MGPMGMQELLISALILIVYGGAIAAVFIGLWQLTKIRAALERIEQRLAQRSDAG